MFHYVVFLGHFDGFFVQLIKKFKTLQSSLGKVLPVNVASWNCFRINKNLLDVHTNLMGERLELVLVNYVCFICMSKIHRKQCFLIHNLLHAITDAHYLYRQQTQEYFLMLEDSSSDSKNKNELLILVFFFIPWLN